MFLKCMVSPALIVSLSILAPSFSKVLLCWSTVYSAAARAPAHSTAGTMRPRAYKSMARFISLLLCIMRQTRRGDDHRHAGQRFQKFHEGFLLLLAQILRLQIGIDVIPSIAAAIVMRHLLFERAVYTVVLIRRGEGDIAQGRRLEGALHDRQRHLGETAGILIAFQSNVVKTIVDEIEALMTGRAIGLAFEQRKAALRAVTDRLVVASDPAIERLLARVHRAFEACECLGDGLLADAFAGIGRFEHGDVTGDGLQLVAHLVQVLIHLAFRADGPECLLLQRGEAAVPHLFALIGSVQYRRRRAAQHLHAVTDRRGQAVGPAEGGVVTRRAADPV